jgi:citronellol/citronellal dehydrogenase
MVSTLSGKTLFITGASRGIGLAIGLRCARDGANVAIAAKTAEPNPKLPGTIYSAAEEIEKAGGKALPLAVDVRDEERVREALERTAATFGGLDIVVNNASAISLTDSQATDMKRFDLMHQINARGTFMASKFAVPYLEKAGNPHILMLSPPLDLKEKWFAPFTAYAMAKYGMSLIVLGLAGELRPKRIAVNALWPRTTIATSAIKTFRGDAVMRASRTPAILADAAHAIFLKDAKTFTGNFLIDDTFLFSNGVRDFDRYRVDPGRRSRAGLFCARRLGTAGQPSKGPVRAFGPPTHRPMPSRPLFRPDAASRGNVLLFCGADTEPVDSLAVEPDEPLTVLIDLALVAHAADAKRFGYRAERLGADRNANHAARGSPIGIGIGRGAGKLSVYGG